MSSWNAPWKDLWEILEAKKGNTAAQLTALENWLETTDNWWMNHDAFGETFKFFRSNSSTACACADKFGAHLGRVYCAAIAKAVHWVENSAAALSAVEKLIPACKDKENFRTVLHELAGPPNFCNVSAIHVCSQKFDHELDIDVCRQIVKKYGDDVRSKQLEAEQAEMDKELDAEMAAQKQGWFKRVAELRGRPIYIKFWEKMAHIQQEGGSLSDKDGMFSPADQEFTFMKLGGSNPLSFLGGISFLKKFTELKFEVRKGIMKAGILFYFKNSQAKGCIPVHRPAEIGPIEPVKNSEGQVQGYAFTLKTKLPRRFGAGDGCEWKIGGKTEAEAQEVLAAVERARG